MAFGQTDFVRAICPKDLHYEVLVRRRMQPEFFSWTNSARSPRYLSERDFRLATRFKSLLNTLRFIPLSFAKSAL